MESFFFRAWKRRNCAWVLVSGRKELGKRDDKTVDACFTVFYTRKTFQCDGLSGFLISQVKEGMKRNENVANQNKGKSLPREKVTRNITAVDVSKKPSQP